MAYMKVAMQHEKVGRLIVKANDLALKWSQSAVPDSPEEFEAMMTEGSSDGNED